MADQPPDGNAPDGANNEAETPEEQEVLDPNNPLLDRVQATIFKNLSEQNKTLADEIREKEEALRITKKKRLDLGVQVYGVQQSLAKLQVQCESASATHSTLKGLREEAETRLKEFRANYEVQHGDLKSLREQLRKFQMELDTVNATLGQVDLYNDELKAQIAVTRRATYKAEENLAGLEKEKTRQDLEIDRLNNQLRRLQEEKALYEAQLVSQRGETTQAAATLAEAAAEMEAVAHEKKQLLAQWKSSLIGMARRDEALQAAEEAVRKQKDALLSLENEVNGLKRAIKAEGEKGDRLTALLSKTDVEVKYLETQTQQLNREKTKHKEDLAQFQTVLEQSELEMKAVGVEKQGLTAEHKVLDKEIRDVLKKRQDHENESSRSLAAQVALKKGAEATVKASDEVRKAIHEQENKVADCENELSRIKVDTLNTQAHNERLQENLAQLLKELKENEDIASKYQSEIHRRNDEIEKKQAEVDRLNKRLDQLAASFQDENTGPLEATINSLQKSISGKEHECTELQVWNYWLRSQKELVDLEKQAQAQTDNLQELRSKMAVLRQRKLRLENSGETEQQQIREYQAVVRQQQAELRRLNERIAGNETLQRALAEGNLALEGKFVRRLQDSEAEAIKLGQTIESLVEEKTFLLSDVIETERQIMIWEKKIQLAKETQDALDPDVDAAEVAQMRKEIHRMKLRHESLLRKQETMVQEMERAVVRREHIRTRGKLAATKAGAGTPVTRGAVQQSVVNLGRDIRQAAGKVSAADAELSELKLRQTATSVEVEQKTAHVGQMRQERDAAVADAVQMEQARRTAKESIDRYNRTREWYDKALVGQYKPAAKPETIDAALARHRERREQIEDTVKALKSVFGGYAEELDGILASMRT